MKKPIYFSLVAIGATAVSGQIVLLRELFTVFYGNELSLGFTLAIWLIGGAIGSGLLGGLLADRLKVKIFIFAFIQLTLGLLLPLAVIFARISKVLLGVGMGEIVSIPVFLSVCAMTLLPVSVFLGFLFVLGCKIIPKSETPAAGIGQVYTLEAIGAVAGGFITSLILIRYFGALEIAILLAFLNISSSYFILTGLTAHKEKILRTLSVAFCLALAIFVISGGLNRLDKKSFESEWRGFDFLESKDSVYGRTTVTKRDNQFNFFENGLFLFASSDPLNAEETVHLPFSFSPDPKKILLIGGSPEVIFEILKYPLERLDYIELNPAIVSLSKKYLRKEPSYRLEDPRVNIVNEDGRYFVKNAETLYDVTIVSLPNPYTAQINRFYTREFFGEIKKILNAGGVLSFSVTSSENYISREEALFLKTLFETASSEFSDVKITPGDTAYFLLTNDRNKPFLDYKDITSALKSRRIDTAYVREYYLASNFSEERVRGLRLAIARAPNAPRNTDFHPVSYFYDMVLWSTYLNFGISKFFIFLNRKIIFSVTICFFLLLFFIFFARRRKQNFKKEVTLLALGTTGLSEISFEILIILAFQIIYGYIYYKIGIIVTSFMVGLALGSIHITRKLKSISEPFRLYTKLQAAIFVYPLFLIVFFKIFSSLQHAGWLRWAGANIFALLPFIAGFAGGVQYPLANKICFTQTQKEARLAGTTYAVDLFGSFIGALLLSAFFVPIVGVSATCILVAGLNFVSLVLLLMADK